MTNPGSNPSLELRMNRTPTRPSRVDGRTHRRVVTSCQLCSPLVPPRPEGPLTRQSQSLDPLGEKRGRRTHPPRPKYSWTSTCSGVLWQWRSDAQRTLVRVTFLLFSLRPLPHRHPVTAATRTPRTRKDESLDVPLERDCFQVSGDHRRRREEGEGKGRHVLSSINR